MLVIHKIVECKSEADRHCAVLFTTVHLSPFVTLRTLAANHWLCQPVSNQSLAKRLCRPIPVTFEMFRNFLRKIYDFYHIKGYETILER